MYRLEPLLCRSATDGKVTRLSIVVWQYRRWYAHQNYDLAFHHMDQYAVTC
jgi:hypothetical protein